MLINDVWGGDELTEWGKPFWEHFAAKRAADARAGGFTPTSSPVATPFPS